jgi:hypothetical protein
MIQAIKSKQLSSEYFDLRFKKMEAQLNHKLEKMHANILRWFIAITFTQIIGIFIPLALHCCPK